MRKKHLSPLGYLMECLNIQTVSLSRFIHVDASLVSKWKSGDRHLTPKSIYFEDIINYFMEQSAASNHLQLKRALMELYPHEVLEDNELFLKNLLQEAISSGIRYPISAHDPFGNDVSTVSAMVFEQNSGRRNAVSRIMEFAEKMSSPGEFVFIDNEEFDWLLEDHAYVQDFVRRFEALIHLGFKATFVLHHASYRSKILKLFEECSPLIFHKNITWYYNEYYDESLLNYSFYILNHAVSLLGISTDIGSSSSIIFTDTALVIQHEIMARHIIKKCSPIFINFDAVKIEQVLQDVSPLRKNGTLYSYLPYPIFISVEEPLLLDILAWNHAEESCIEKCLSLNRCLHNIASFHLDPERCRQNPLIYIFRLESLLACAKKDSFLSRSLEIACGRPIYINSGHYAAHLRSLAERLMKNETFKIMLISDKDQVMLPSINCWCKQNLWMLQMNDSGLRLSSEYNIVNAASAKWEHCIHRIPAERREALPVCHFLLELADHIENKTDF